VGCESLVGRLVEQDFADVFKPASKDELASKRGWAFLTSERSEVTPVEDLADIRKYSKMKDQQYRNLYVQGCMFYGVRDRVTKNTFIVAVYPNKTLRVYGKDGDIVKHVFENDSSSC
jgi:hypothetical protein